MEKESPPKFTITEMQPDDIGESTDMRYRSWSDTYVNEEYGVTQSWVNERSERQTSDTAAAERRERFLRNKANNSMNAWVARDSEGHIIGSTTPYIDKDGVQHLGSLYVDKLWHGTGVASQLMQRVVDWLDPSKPIVLGVVAYNDRAKAFYRKWGFEEVPDSEWLLEGKIPEVRMIRKGETYEV